MSKWYIYNKKADFAGISKKFNITPMLARILKNRDISTDEQIKEYIYGDLSYLHDPFLLNGVEDACQIIFNSISNNDKIRIMGDYDIDGICSSYILKTYLSAIGADADADIPDRVTDGYGLSLNMVEKAYNDGVNLIITCDNGISARESINKAKELNITVIVTDHHEIPSELPKADIIINPHMENSGYPCKDLCGAGVAFKLICGLEAYGNNILVKDNHFINPVIDELLLFAGFATVGDIVPLVGENRILVKEGLKRLRETKNLGLNALIEVRNLNKVTIECHHIGFVLGPCINAAGRLKDAKIALKMLEAKSYDEAKQIAGELSRLNEERKELTDYQVEQALEKIKSENINDKILVIELPNAHESIIGIVAGRLKEEFNRPAIIISNTETGRKGSGRSVDSYNIFEEISKFPDLFEKYGGHAKACGFTLKNSSTTEELRLRLNESCDKSLEELQDKTWIDMQLPFEYASIEFTEEINTLAPFGVGNSKPLFAEKDILVTKSAILGKDGKVLKLNLVNKNGTAMEGIMFGQPERIKKYSDDLFEASQKNPENVRAMFTYVPRINEFRGRKTVQAVIDELIVE